MFKSIYKKLFKYERQEKLEEILINLNTSVRNIKADFDMANHNTQMVKELYENKLNNHKLLKSIYDISMVLFKNADLDTALMGTLQILVSQGYCQKTFIFKNNLFPEYNCSKKIFECCESSIVGVKETNITFLNWDNYPNWKNKLIHDLFICGTKDNFERKNKKRILTKFGVESILILPIFLNSKWWGSLVLGTIYSKQWEQQEIDVLLSICNIIGTAIRRNELERNLKVCQNRSISFLKDIVDNIDGMAFWMKDINNKYVFSDNLLISLIYPDKQLCDIIGKTDHQITLNTNNLTNRIDFSKVYVPEDLGQLDLSEYDTKVEMCNITDQITKHFNFECNFFEVTDDKCLEVLKIPLFRQKTRNTDNQLGDNIFTGTVGALVDVTNQKEKKYVQLDKLIKDGSAIRIGNSKSYYLKTKLFPVIEDMLIF